MHLINYGHRDFKSIYHAAIRGAYFGIFNALFVFVSFLYSLWSNKPKFFVYCGVAVLIVTSLLVITVCYRKKYNYQVNYLRYLLFAGTYTLIFYSGYISYLYRTLHVKLFTLDGYILLVYLLLTLLSSIDVLSCAFKGYRQIRRFYTRTYQRQTATNVLLILSAIFFGALLLLPQYLL